MKATVGRRVWFWPAAFGPASLPFQRQDQVQPCDAGIVYVHSDSMVNLDVCDHLGKHTAVLSVPLYGPDEVVDPNLNHATWMPYQVNKVAEPAAV